MTELRIVLDSNVVISAALHPQSVTRQAFDQAAAAGQLLLSEATLTEMDDVFRRPKFDKYVSEAKRLEFLLGLVAKAEVVPISIEIRRCRDPKDDKFLELADSGRATHLVTGDPDLLTLNPFQGVAILSPRDFLKDVAE